MYKNYMKKTFVIYLVMLINLTIQITINLATYYFDGRSKAISFYTIYGTDYMTGFLILLSFILIALAFSQAIVLVSIVFNMDQFFGKHNKQNILDIMKFTIVHAFMLSTLANLIIWGLENISNVNIPIIMGFRWFEFSQMPQKIFLLSIILITFYGLGMWLTAGFKRHGVFNGLARIALVITYVVHHAVYFSDFYTWGVNGIYNVIIFLLVIIITYSHTYFNMLHHERRN